MNPCFSSKMDGKYVWWEHKESFQAAKMVIKPHFLPNLTLNVLTHSFEQFVVPQSFSTSSISEALPLTEDFTANDGVREKLTLWTKKAVISHQQMPARLNGCNDLANHYTALLIVSCRYLCHQYHCRYWSIPYWTYGSPHCQSKASVSAVLFMVVLWFCLLCF